MTPREAFIEATRKVLEACPCSENNGRPPGQQTMACSACYSVESHHVTCMDPIHAAVLAQVEAFADSVCQAGDNSVCEVATMTADIDHLTDNDAWSSEYQKRKAANHASCRAALRKECGL